MITDPTTAVRDLNRIIPRGRADLTAITQAISLIEYQAAKIKDQRMALTDMEKKRSHDRLIVDAFNSLMNHDDDQLCKFVSHRKKDIHGYGTSCPVVARLRKLNEQGT